ncbi:DEAD/DEAH box helicase family protein [Rodentibacter pneumotropicus]|uniref:Type III restriction endonuclease subunit R n=1 Tax=Rodentibacter pneumotropicus TaxID=758 RepID=A0A4S2QCL9_9PAST|nr:DEAD/DEAH box helicase family protein [Rodentibacter pneumotropicus]TGZ98566.1 type III restriction endonuclease subunit R [Rodentibacter pneumotropicus]TGZ99522.1 type III restriction endonuclease subunit R [Rodentibacter pneumotropicus]THA05946.1 type III restriction endonuclease subunit R [Rodentibacter pneumotropicus]THA14690.1 type III restriction endonuclease subunit R [Rodentibacter pneumotropicus]
MAKKTKPQSKITFHDHLVLNRYFLSLFNAEKLQGLKTRLGDEGRIENGQTRFFDALVHSQLFHTDKISENDLLCYDRNIVRHWQKITEKRNDVSGHVLQMKYFQYLSLLFTEIYLDFYFNRQTEFLAALNAQLEKYQAELGDKNAEKRKPYIASDLNTVAFWNATGSGKTLLMHVNILQYLDYCPEKIDKIIVLTPREGLSNQHVAELEESCFSASLFDKNRISSNLSMNFNSPDTVSVEVIDINKLGEKSGDKTVALAELAGYNLVLVDEGHSGSSAEDGAWQKRREALISDGFAFEYSATLGQAVNGKKNALRGKYAKCILFDYSYKYFYADGYGKESLILNLKNDYFAEHEKLYFTACLLSFYQQMYLFEKFSDKLTAWNIEKPLMVFVGKSVADKTGSSETAEQKQEKSDVQKILDFLAFFLNEPEWVKRYLADLVADKARLLDSADNNIFLQRFTPLMDFVGREDDLYADMLKRLFNADSQARLQLKLLKKALGELSLSVGNYPAFGVINIGSATDFAKSAENNPAFDTANDEFGEGLFESINQKSSSINVLIGAKKFTEGWSSWRVSTMGLLNMGKKEGSQIIQMFGRGVRLKGRDFSLKRSTREERPKGVYLEKLETLNIFGINANYMDQFRAYLAEEGVNLDEIITIDFKVQPNLPKGIALKTLKLDEEYKGNRQKSFKRMKNVYLFEIPEEWQGKVKEPMAILDCYPRLEAVVSKGNQIEKSLDKQKKQGTLDRRLFDLFDWDKIYLNLQKNKMLQSLNNLRLDRERLKKFAYRNDWYKLYIPPTELMVTDFSAVQKQEELMLELLTDYLEAFYEAMKGAYEGQFYREIIVDEENGSIAGNYEFTVNVQADGGNYQTKLEDLKARVESGELAKVLGWKAPNIEAICFNPHLFYPIMTLENQAALPFTMKPLSMNEKSEIQFVEDLKNAHTAGLLTEWTGGKTLYLLRNAANKAKGLGFALAGNFYPDFLLWLVDKENGKQWLTFVDPKGIRNMTWEHPKFSLFESVKNLEKSLKLGLTLNSFILSITPYSGLLNDGAAALYDKTEEEFADKHILFMDKADYLQKMFMMILTDAV